MTSWKIVPDPTANKVEYTPFLKSRKFFAVDDSGSTAGSILRRERAFVDHVHECFATPDDSVSLWGTDCDAPTKTFDSAQWRSNHSGTRPAQILRLPAALTAIQKSDVWFLLTDGEIYDRDVHLLAELAHEHGVLSVPIVFLIVGSRGRTPDTTNISVGISFFAGSQDTLILFKETETGKVFVIAGKGCFASLGGSAAAQDLASWSAMPVFENEAKLFKHFDSLDIKIATAESRANFPKGVNLGPEWETAQNGPAWVDLDILTEAGVLSDNDVSDLFAEEAFNILSVAFKTRRRIPELRSLVQAQKIEQVAPKLEDVSGAATIISQMGHPDTNDDERKSLQERLREAHVKNRDHYQKTVAEFAGSPKEQSLKKRNQLVDAALRALANIEAASFSADLLSRRSNRARRAEVVASDTTVPMTNLNLEGPSYKGFCLICCGEEEVMAICLKELESEHIDNNTTDFALNFPLAAGSSPKNVNIVSSQNVCFQCALLGPSGLSIYKEKLKAIIPTVHYEGSNKKYINDQLYLALTTGLATGAAGIAQLFMAILDEILKTKTWAGASLDESNISASEQHEAVQRRQTFRWMLDELMQNTRTRQTFTEIGDWVKFPEALAWVAKEFETDGLGSFAVTYPVAGFPRLLSFGRQTDAFSEEVVRQMKVAKAVYSVAAKYLADMQSMFQGPDSGNDWKQKYLEIIYQEFNTSLVPKDGPQALVTDVGMFAARLSVCLGRAGDDWGSAEDKQNIMRKVQVILFWLIYRQKSHCTAQTFFHKINHEEHLATAVLNPSLSVPESELRMTLLSIFAMQDAELINADAAVIHDNIIPFKTPFGPSVLGCGIEACNESFVATDTPEFTPQGLQAIRYARSQHLIKVFGIRGRFEQAETGLPERSAIGKPPSSIHFSLHISVVRTWAEQTREKRHAILNDENAREEFVTAVRKRVCEQGRGNIFQPKIEQDVRGILPSFWKVLAQALRLEGKSDDDITVYEHDFDLNKMEAKMRYELKSMEG
ncbi:hypothetical protein K505DRAFT_293946 [Melanomma pulvis-pyrius CBS 109.77]|uniref:Uncharacterized protein n=1 Tax=Melanomma pulvis-pyrius CBS 109.77 TaxID=1314802 RepID=A0A6A6XTR6_9PLEO|nr:hypothetical protein K505DRAFT_293946 [Melanomma pulvis-pyrius CBS 109.77]